MCSSKHSNFYLGTDQTWNLSFPYSVRNTYTKSSNTFHFGKLTKYCFIIDRKNACLQQASPNYEHYNIL